MPALGGLVVSILQNEVALQEYHDPQRLEDVPGNRSVYVEVTANGSFSIAVLIPDWMPLLGDTIVADITFDGHKTDEYIINCPGQPVEIQGLFDQHHFHPLTFASLNGVDNETGVSYFKEEHVGTIVVRLRHARVISDMELRNPMMVPDLMPPKLTNAELEKRSISHHVALESSIALGEPHTLPYYGIIGEERDCYVFQFKYRSRRMLEKLRIIETLRTDDLQCNKP